jgi:hypothetical protein
MIVKEFEGRSEKEAIDRAIEELGLDRNEIDFEIVESKRRPRRWMKRMSSLPPGMSRKEGVLSPAPCPWSRTGSSRRR